MLCLKTLVKNESVKSGSIYQRDPSKEIEELKYNSAAKDEEISKLKEII